MSKRLKNIIRQNDKLRDHAIYVVCKAILTICKKYKITYLENDRGYFVATKYDKNNDDHVNCNTPIEINDMIDLFNDNFESFPHLVLSNDVMHCSKNTFNISKK